MGQESGQTDDLVQDTLLQTFKRIGDFEPRRVGALQAYLRQAVLNRLRDELRRHGRRPDMTELDGLELAADQSPLEEAIGREAVELYEAALQRLRPEEREAIIARVEMDFTYQEMAEALGKPSAEAARKAAQRALVRLAEEMRSAGGKGKWCRVAASEGLLADLAGAILDGTPIDWDAAESSADDGERPLVAHLRLVAGVAGVHRATPPPSSGRNAAGLSLATLSESARTRQDRAVGAPAGARAHRQRRVRRGVPRLGHAARSRSGAQAAGGTLRDR